MRKLVVHSLRETVGSLQAREYWASRLMWTDGKTKTIAEGGKNMRRVAQRFDLRVQQPMTDQERWTARRDSEILLVNDNVHMPRSDEAEPAFLWTSANRATRRCSEPTWRDPTCPW